MPRLKLALALSSALALLGLPGLAAAGIAGFQPPVGSYGFTGSCAVGCTGGATGELLVNLSDPPGSSFTLSFSNVAAGLNGETGAGSALQDASSVSGNYAFGPLTFVGFFPLPVPPANGAFVAQISSATYNFYTSNISPLNWEFRSSTNTVLASGTNGLWVSQVPEVETLALMLSGLGALVLLVRRCRATG